MGIENLVPQGRQFCGLPIVDGYSIIMSFDQALANGLNNVPLMYGSMAQETDFMPVVDVSDLQPPQWAAYLNTAVEGMGIPMLGEQLLKLYANDSSPDPDKAYSTFNTDYGLTCGNVAVAMGAKLGNFTSNLYMWLNAWSPVDGIPLWNGRYARYSFHTFDWMAACEAWPLLWAPQGRDWQLSDMLQQYFYSFAATGIPKLRAHSSITTTTPSFLPFDSAPDFPSSYSTFVFNPSASGMVDNYKAGTCAAMSLWGFTQSFWWVN